MRDGDEYEADVKFVGAHPVFNEHGTVTQIIALDSRGAIWCREDGYWTKVEPPKEKRYFVSKVSGG